MGGVGVLKESLIVMVVDADVDSNEG